MSNALHSNSNLQPDHPTYPASEALLRDQLSHQALSDEQREEIVQSARDQQARRHSEECRRIEQRIYKHGKIQLTQAEWWDITTSYSSENIATMLNMENDSRVGQVFGQVIRRETHRLNRSKDEITQSFHRARHANGVDAWESREDQRAASRARSAENKAARIEARARSDAAKAARREARARSKQTKRPRNKAAKPVAQRAVFAEGPQDQNLDQAVQVAAGPSNQAIAGASINQDEVFDFGAPLQGAELNTNQIDDFDANALLQGAEPSTNWIEGFDSKAPLQSETDTAMEYDPNPASAFDGLLRTKNEYEVGGRYTEFEFPTEIQDGADFDIGKLFGSSDDEPFPMSIQHEIDAPSEGGLDEDIFRIEPSGAALSAEPFVDLQVEMEIDDETAQVSSSSSRLATQLNDRALVEEKIRTAVEDALKKYLR